MRSSRSVWRSYHTSSGLRIRRRAVAAVATVHGHVVLHTSAVCLGATTPISRAGRGGTSQFSLSELASAFSELGKVTAASSSQSSGSQQGADPQMRRIAEGAAGYGRESAVNANETARGPTHNACTALTRSSREDTLIAGRESLGARRTSPRASPAATATHKSPSSQSQRGGLVTFSLSYSQHLAEMDAARLTAEVEEQHRRQHYGNMMSCLLELYFRHAEHAHVSRGDADEDDRKAALSDVLGDDALLFAALSCLTKLDLSEVEEDLEAWIPQLSIGRRRGLFGAHQQSSKSAASGPRKNPTAEETSGDERVLRRAFPSPRFLTTFSELMQRWLLERVAAMEVAQSVTALHLLAQQKLFFSDPLLATLADNIACRHASRSVETLTAPHTAGPRATIPSDDRRPSGDVLPLDVCAVLLDVLARYQVNVMTALRVMDQTLSSDHTSGEEDALADLATTESAGSHGMRRTSAARQRRAGALSAIVAVHPVLNASFFNVCTEALVQSLEYAAEQEKTSSTPQRRDEPNKMSTAIADDPATWAGTTARAASSPPPSRVVRGSGHNVTRFAQLPTASFFFLTRALAKLRFFDEQVIPALLPHLAEYVRQHPEQYLGPVLLLGRPENTSIDVDVAMLLLQNINEVLRRRGTAFGLEMRSQRQAQQQRDAPPNVTDHIPSSVSADTSTEKNELGSDGLWSDVATDTLEDELLSFIDSSGRAVGTDPDEKASITVVDDDRTSRTNHSGAWESGGEKAEHEGDVTSAVCASSSTTSIAQLEANPALGYRARHGKMVLSQQIARAQAQVALAVARADDNYRHHPQRVSFIAFHVSPAFWSNLVHMYRLAWDHAMTGCGSLNEAAQGWARRRALLEEIVRLQQQLLDDLEHGLPRQLEVLTRSMSAAVVEALLLALLEGRELLQNHFQLLTKRENVASTPAHARDTQNGTKKNIITHTLTDDQLGACLHAQHSFLVALTFLWTQQLRRWPLPREKRKVTVEWCPSAAHLTRALLAAGLLERRDLKPASAHARPRRSDGGSHHYHSGHSGGSGTVDGTGLFYLHFIPEALLRTAPRVDELVQRSKLTKLLSLRDGHVSTATRDADGEEGRGDTDVAPPDPLVREVRNSSVFFPFSRRIEFAESGHD